MPPALDIIAHQPLLDIWQHALESPRGVKLSFSSQEDARAQQKRLFHARAAQRRHHAKVYPSDHPQFGKSFYEHLSVRLLPEECALLIQENSLEFQVEEL